jgi:uncharacterized protein (TIGR03435 family)
VKKGLALPVALVCGCLSIGLPAQERLPSFEVATIKPSGPDSGPISIRRWPGGRLTTSSTSLPMLIQWAYQLDEGRLVNVPSGLGSLGFDIVAKAPDEAPLPGQLQLMMRTLLAERFKLVVHHDTRELMAYALVTDTGGSRVRASAADQPIDPNPFRMSDSGTLAGTGVTADMLATVLSNQLGRPVRNTTGFAGRFDFTLRWAPDTAQANADTTDRASLFTAIREQLGFRLVAEKTAVDVVVIDSVERTPVEN